jgi:ABC-2 type transport system permease protein
MIRGELAKLLRRPRTWVSLTLLCLLPFVVALFIAGTDIASGPEENNAFLAVVLTRGALYPAAALAMVVPLFLPIAVAVLAGDSVAGEASVGTLRYVLVRPVGRTRLLIAKLVSVTVFTLMAVVLVVLTSLATGLALFHDTAAATTVVSLSGANLSTGQIVARTCASLAFITISMLGVAAVAIFLSTLVDSPLGATLGALAVLIASTLLVTLRAATAIRPYLPTRYWLAWVDLFREPILWRDVTRGVGIQAAYVAVFLLAAWANFMTKDVTS